jgi:hypothetical protein
MLKTTSELENFKDEYKKNEQSKLLDGKQFKDAK